MTDRFFSTEQKQRLAELMARWRAARESQYPLPPDLQAELDALVDAELEAATQRARAVLDERKR